MKEKAKAVIGEMLDNALKALKIEIIPSEDTLEMIRVALHYAFLEFETNINLHSLAEEVERTLQEPFEQ